jgi:hypothetical protein
MKKLITAIICIWIFVDMVQAQPYYVKYYGSSRFERAYSITANGNKIVQVGNTRSTPTNADIYWTLTNPWGVIINSMFINLGGDECAYSVKHNPAIDEYITTGYSTRLDSDSSTCAKDVFLMASDKNGFPLWSRRYGFKSTDDIAQSVIVTSDNNYLVTGYTTFKCDSDSLSCKEHNVLLFKTDWAGNLLWSKSIDIAKGDDYGMKVIEARNGDYYVAGSSMSGNNFEPFLMSVKSNGSVNWVGFYGSKTEDKAMSLVETGDGIMVVGHTYGFNSGAKPDILVFKTDYNGAELWKAEYNTTNNSRSSFGRDIIHGKDDFYYITGIADDISNANYFDVDFLVIDQNGVKQFETNIGGSKDDQAYSIIETPNGFKIAGYSYSWSNGQDDAIQINAPSNGQVGNCWVEDGQPETYIKDYVFPYFNSCDYLYSDSDSLSYRNVFYQKLACGNDTDTLPHRFGKFEYENSVAIRSNVIHSSDPLQVFVNSIEFDELELSIWSTDGKLINTFRRPVKKGSNDFSFQLDDLKSGCYILSISGNQITQSLRFVKL